MIIKVLLADDQCLMLEGMKAILQQESEIEVVGTAQDGRAAIAQVKKLQPDIVLIDIEMPKMNGITATKYICEYLPDTRVIVLTSHKNQKYVTQALQAGASGYLLKDSLLKDLKQAIYSLGRGYSYIEAKLLTQAVTKVQTANMIKYQEKITYLKKHRKSIYKPPLKKPTKSSVLSQNSNLKRKPTKPKYPKSTKIGVTKANLAPIFDPPSIKELLSTSHNLTVKNSKKFNRQRYLKRIGWLLMAIGTFILSILIF